MMDYDATFWNPSAMYNERSIHPKIENGLAFKRYKNNVYVEAFKNQTFNQNGNESANLEFNFYNPRELIFQDLSAEEKVKKIEVNTMRNGYIVDVLTWVVFQEMIEIGGRLIEIYKGVI